VRDAYLATAKALVAAAPHVFWDDTFALKGGTAINLFMRDMPRLSVDLDLVFVDPALLRDAALAKVKATLQQARERLAAAGFVVQEPTSDADETRLLVRRGAVQVKIDVNHVFRGTVWPVAMRGLSPRASDELLAELEIPVASLEDVYGGKLVAALARQHPRDLFDVMQLFAHEGVTEGIRRAFVVYLAGHNRPIHEVLFPNLRDIEQEYRETFVGMTAEEVALDTLHDARAKLLRTLHASLDGNERQFLVSVARNQPQWDLLDLDHVKNLPALRWKMRNLDELQKSNPDRLRQQADELQRRLGL
jgi:predicted nucleotidyltransferase component of viral defense system